MENIKYRFRVRRKRNDVELIDFFYFTLKDILDGLHKGLKIFYEEHEILSVDRFTGLFDIKEKEMYENDITKNKQGNFQIVFSEGAFMLQDGDYQSLIITLDELECEVIGNIHENPELIEK